MTRHYLTTVEVCERFGISRTTLYRWRTRPNNPFPAPRISNTAGNNRWAIADIERYESELAA